MRLPGKALRKMILNQSLQKWNSNQATASSSLGGKHIPKMLKELSTVRPCTYWELEGRVFWVLHIYNHHWLWIVTPDVTLQDHSDTLLNEMQGQTRIVYSRLVIAMEKVDMRWGGFNLDLARKPGEVFTVHLLVFWRQKSKTAGDRYMALKKMSQEQL